MTLFSWPALFILYSEMWARGNHLQKISLFASTIDIIQKQRVEVQQAAFLKPDVQSFFLLLLASTFIRKKDGSYAK